MSLLPQLHKQADMQEEKNRIERVLGAISAPDLIQKVLNFALSVHATFLLLACKCAFVSQGYRKRNEPHVLRSKAAVIHVVFSDLTGVFTVFVSSPKMGTSG